VQQKIRANKKEKKKIGNLNKKEGAKKVKNPSEDSAALMIKQRLSLRLKKNFASLKLIRIEKNYFNK
jgi:hypothetical protein